MSLFLCFFAPSGFSSGGGHCAIGGGKFDFLVTSTLSSQCPPAVGRAMGNSLAHFLKGASASAGAQAGGQAQASELAKALRASIPAFQPAFPKDAVSFVSLGDGSVNNAHFLAGIVPGSAARCAVRFFSCCLFPRRAFVSKFTPVSLPCF